MALSDSNQTSVDRLTRAARGSTLLGGWTFVAVGLGHLATQFTTLSSDLVRSQYRAGGDVAVGGRVTDGWDLFAGTSVLMGVFSVALGAALLVGLHHTARTDRLPPVGASITSLVTVVCIFAVGATLLGPLQVIGGLAGSVMFGLPLAAAVRNDAA